MPPAQRLIYSRHVHKIAGVRMLHGGMHRAQTLRAIRPADTHLREPAIGRRWWHLQSLSRRRMALVGLLVALLFLSLAVARNIDRSDSDPVAYRVWTATSAITAAPSINVANTGDEWREMWMKAGRAAPPFDPARATGVGIFLGERIGDLPPAVRVVGASQRGQRLIVTFEEVGHPVSAAVKPAAAQVAPVAPWAILTIDKTGLPISVEERIRY